MQVNLIDTKTCNKPEAYNNTLTPRMLCAGSLEGKRDACQVSGLAYNFLAKNVMLHKFLFILYFEKVIDLQKVAEIVQRALMYISPNVPSGYISHNYSTP